MPAARDVMATELIQVDAATALREAAALMHAQRVGAALVLVDGRLSGILTERDVLRAVAEDRVDETTVADWMTGQPETIELDETTSTAAALMIHGGFRHLPVVDAGTVVGIISIRDLMRVVLDDETPRGV